MLGRINRALSGPGKLEEEGQVGEEIDGPERLVAPRVGQGQGIAQLPQLLVDQPVTAPLPPSAVRRPGLGQQLHEAVRIPVVRDVFEGQVPPGVVVVEAEGLVLARGRSSSSTHFKALMFSKT